MTLQWVQANARYGQPDFAYVYTGHRSVGDPRYSLGAFTKVARKMWVSFALRRFYVILLARDRQGAFGRLTLSRSWNSRDT